VLCRAGQVGPPPSRGSPGHRGGRDRPVRDRGVTTSTASSTQGPAPSTVTERVITRSAGGRAGGLKPLVPVSVELA